MDAVTYRFQTTPTAAKIRVRVFLYTDTTGTFGSTILACIRGLHATRFKRIPCTFRRLGLFSSLPSWIGGGWRS
jgi:hypothetical protein